MKPLSFLLFFLLSFNFNIHSQITPTFADLPAPENVLVVYDASKQISVDVMNYYVQSREIPVINTFGLDEIEPAYITYEGETHYIRLDRDNELIVDENNEYIWTPTKHAWVYFNERILLPIADYLQTNYVGGTPLKDIIRYIVI